MVQKRLYYSSVDPAEGPRFTCPICGERFIDDTELTQARKTIRKAVSDFNHLVKFTCPRCGEIFELYVALHRNETGGLDICIQRSDEEGAKGIKADWWKTAEMI